VSETEVLPEQKTRVQEDVRPDLSHGDGDHERFAHYVQKNKIVESSVMGTPLVALCGKVWVPSRDPKRVPDLQGDLRRAPSRRRRRRVTKATPACRCQRGAARAGSISAS
jgi:hypothetical protein